MGEYVAKLCRPSSTGTSGRAVWEVKAEVRAEVREADLIESAKIRGSRGKVEAEDREVKKELTEETEAETAETAGPQEVGGPAEKMRGEDLV